MLQKIVPETIMQPFNNAYSHGVLIPPNARVLHLSGQIGARPDGVVPDDAAILLGELVKSSAGPAGDMDIRAAVGLRIKEY